MNQYTITTRRGTYTVTRWPSGQVEIIKGRKRVRADSPGGQEVLAALRTLLSMFE